ncbi:Peptidyl-prolyl cis-trans isomerase pin4 [Myotisia sp. PD_48]|nr:Peptidyl-prolyl cis-trans isomerase pin4 [Myotisia sp. PD_48]
MAPKKGVNKSDGKKASSDTKNNGKKASGPDTKDEGKKKGLKPATSINVRHILCEKFSRKQEALAKLEAGTKFDEVAREFSEDKARQGGSLGWKTRGALHGDFESVAYSIEPSTTANPKYAEVKTPHGYHIIMIEGRK